LGWLQIEDVRRLVVAVEIVIISELLIIEGKLYMSLSLDIGGRGLANDLVGVDHLCGHQAQALEVAESVIVVVSVIEVEWVEIVTQQEDVIASIVWPSVRNQLGDRRLVVVPIIDILMRVLLHVEGSGEGD